MLDKVCGTMGIYCCIIGYCIIGYCIMGYCITSYIAGGRSYGCPTGAPYTISDGRLDTY